MGGLRLGLSCISTIASGINLCWSWCRTREKRQQDRPAAFEDDSLSVVDVGATRHQRPRFKELGPPVAEGLTELRRSSRCACISDNTWSIRLAEQ